MVSLDLTFFSVLMSTLLCRITSATVVSLQSHNIDDILHHNEIVMINFYADWCRFSQMLKPVYEQTAQKIAEEFPGTGRVTLGSVDCDRENSIAQKYQVTKYPTLKIFRNGELIKREYRGQRSVDSMSNFLKDQLRDPIVTVTNPEALEEIDTKKRHIIGYFDSNDGPGYSVLRQVGSMLRDDCQFHVALGEAANKEMMSGNRVVFRPSGELSTDVLYNGPVEDYNLLLKWATDKCVPLVREITFENAEELTEEGLPFLILFHDNEDTETPEIFKRVVSKELLAEKTVINFLTADGKKFTHPLHHLGKTAKDLPVLAIDSFRHMYVWKNSPKTDMESPGLLKSFIGDLQSGKLHREFHHGPDPTTKSPVPAIEDAVKDKEATHIPKEDDEKTDDTPDKDPTTPPESTFVKLAPSKERYTLLRNRDEL